MEDENKKAPKIISSSLRKVIHHHKNRSSINDLEAGKKDNLFKKDFPEIKNDKTSKESFNGKNSFDTAKSPLSKFDFYNSSLTKKEEINDDILSESNNTKISKEKKIYLFLKKSFQNPIRTTKVNYSPQVSFRKDDDILDFQNSEFSISDNSDNNNFFSVSIDNTPHCDLMKKI